MSDITLTPDDNLKEIYLNDNEGETHEGRTDSIKINIADIEPHETKNIKEWTDNNEESAISANNLAQDEAISLDVSKANEDLEKDCKDGAVKEYMVYGYYGQKEASLPTTWVQFQGGFDRNRPRLEASGEPLNYDPESRNSFVKLVFSILLVMLLCTAGFTVFVLTSPDVKATFQRHGFLIALPAIILMVGLNYAMACSGCTRIFPCNIICLMLAVFGMSIITGYITSRYDTNIVFYALLATTVTVFVCLLLACSSYDFTQWMLYAVVISVAFGVLAGIVMITMLLMNTYWKPVHLLILFIGTILNVVILIMELQTILGGKAMEMGESDYALGAFLLYTSIIDIFLKLVQILGLLDDF